MSDEPPTTSTSKEARQTGASKPDGCTLQAIHSILGAGLGYDELAAALQEMGRSCPRNTIIEEEFEYFKEEILDMKRERGFRHRPSKVFSNSLNSIVKRLQGESVPGVEVDKEKRRRECRLLSKDAQSNTLRGYITMWEKERNALRVGSPIKGINSQQSRAPTTWSSETGTSQHAPAIVGTYQYHHSVEPQLGPIPNQHYNLETTAGVYTSAYDDHLQLPSSNTTTIPSSEQDRLPVEHIDPSLLALGNADQFVDTEPSQRSQLGTNIASTRQQSLPFRGDAETTLVNWSRLNNYGQTSDPLPSEYTQDVEMPDAGHVGLRTFQITAASERHPELQETGTQVTQWTEPLSYERTVYSPGESDFMSSPGVTEVSTKPTPPRPARKRRRRHRHGVSTSSSDYGTIATEPFASNVIHGEDGMTKGPASSKTSIETMLPGIESTSSQSKASNWGFNGNHATLLEEELEKEKADHQKTKEELDRAMADILDLQEQLEKLQVANKRTSQQYDGLARDLVHERVLLEANLTHQRLEPQRHHSIRLHNSTKVEDLNHTRQSRNVALRPLSIIQSTKASETSAAQSRSLPSSHNATPPRVRFPVATGSSSRSRSTATGSRTSTIRSSSPVPSGGVSAGLSLASRTDQFRPSSSGSHMTQNVNIAVKKGFQGLRHKISNQFLRHDREKINTAQPAPMLKSLPALSPSVPLQREMSHILIDGNKRHTDHTDDSGYASIELERLSRIPPEFPR